MAKLSKDSSPCSLCPRWLDISSAGSPQRTQSYTENGYWSNQQPESSVSDACLEPPRSLFSKPIRTACQCCGIASRSERSIKERAHARPFNDLSGEPLLQSMIIDRC